ncbi:uncharacterized protein LOC116346470, partial [Contarinia nasturtii]
MEALSTDNFMEPVDADPDPSAMQVFTCTVCNASNIMALHRDNHHLKRHVNISKDENIFKHTQVTSSAHSKRMRSISGSSNQSLESIEQAKDKQHPDTQSESMKMVSTKVASNQNYELIHLTMLRCRICRAPHIKENYNQPLDQSICDACKESKNLSQKQAYKRYRFKHTNQADVQPNGGQQFQLNTKMYGCKICGCYAICEDDLEEHHSMNHNDIPMGEDIFQFIGARAYNKCSICDKVVNSEDFKNHLMRTHSRKWKLHSCGVGGNQKEVSGGIIDEGQKLTESVQNKNTTTNAVETATNEQKSIDSTPNLRPVLVDVSSEQNSAKQKPLISETDAKPYRKSHLVDVSVKEGNEEDINTVTQQTSSVVSNTQPTYKCTICNADGISKIHLRSHQWKNHRAIKPIEEMFKPSTRGPNKNQSKVTLVPLPVLAKPKTITQK